MGAEDLIGEKFNSSSPDETEQIGEQCATNWNSPLTVALVGPLGSGKTTFTRGVLRAKGGDEQLARSPSFTLLNQYENTSPRLIHADLYRAKELEAQETIGLEEYFDRALVLVEWGERWKLGWPAETYTVEFAYDGESGRQIIVKEGEPGVAGR